MSLYRQARGRRIWPIALTGVVAGLAGLGAGLAISGGEEPASLDEAMGALQEDVRPALSALELVRIEYPEAVRGGEVVRETELQAALSQAEAARSTLRSAEADLAILAPATAARATELVDRLVEQIQEQSDPRAVVQLSVRAEAAIAGAARVDRGGS
jgi:hypothetical protein